MKFYSFLLHNFLLLISLLLVTQVISEVRVIDGDTLIIEQKKIRLSGIDAPEKSQLCLNLNKVIYSCGVIAYEKLNQLIIDSDFQLIKCKDFSKDHYGRFISNCWIGNIFINSWMVRNGWAMAYQKYSMEFVKEENDAKKEKLGIWNGQFVEPWNWRKGIRIVKEDVEAFQECLIKGNISSSGEKIYHIPEGQYYSRTKITKNKGEKWFCSEEDAKNMGWRKSKR
ncbi:MAG: thermonuclease family protein [Paracoccaceae bacterium]